MKKIVYRVGSSGVKEFLLTNKEMFEAVTLWSKDKNYNCPRLMDTLNRFILFTCDRKDEKRFQHFIEKAPDGDVFQIIYDNRLKNWYQFDKYTDYEKVAENLVMREKGGDAPLLFLPKIYDEEKTQKMLKVLTTVDDFFDKGGELGF